MSEAIGDCWPENAQRLRLGDVEFDLRYRSVHREGVTNELNQRCFDLLLLFLREPRVLHTRDEIFRRVWAGVVVEDANITTSIWLLRKALGDDAKGWIRTVSKQGYVFDPPGELEPVPANDPVWLEPAAPVAPAESVREAAVAPVAAAGGAARKFRAIAIAAVLLIALGGLLVALRQLYPSTSRVTLVAVPDVSLNDEMRWPTELLQNWIEWQLETRTDRITLTAPSAQRESADTIVLLSAAMPVGRDGEWHVRAHLHQAGRNANFDVGSAPDQLLATIDEVSRRVVRRFMPEVPVSELPSLAVLDAATAPVLVKALVAEQRGRWHEAAQRYRQVLEAAPDFGFARLHLAMALAELGQSNAAQAELDLAERWVQRLPQSMRPLQEARMLAIRQDYLAAAARFGELWQRSPAKRLGLRLDEVTNLRRGGRSRDALERISSASPTTPGLSLCWLLERAEVEFATLDLARSRASAAEAIKLATALGWDLDRARATLLLIDVMAWSGLTAEDALYDDAIAGFTVAGDRIGMLRAKLMRGIRDAKDDAAKLDVLDELLAEARAAGNASAEIDALRRVGQWHLRNGDTRRAGERLHQAEAVALSVGDRYQQREISANLLGLDSWRGDLDAVDRRIRGLKNATLQGGLAFNVGMAESQLQYRRGEYEAALTTLGATQEMLRLGDAGGLPPVAAGLDCVRASVLVRLGRIADARTATNACGSPQLPMYALTAKAHLAELAILAGDTTAATSTLRALADATARQASAVERWQLVAEIAPLLSRIGEAQRARELVDSVLPAVAASGFAATEIDVRMGAAEIALAQSRLTDARRELALVEARVESGDWFAQQRLRSLDVALLRSEGRHDEADRLLAELHEQMRSHGDVPGELFVHGIAGLHLPELCPPDRHAWLLAQSGMRGATQSRAPAAVGQVRVPLTRRLGKVLTEAQ
ncbi:MAG TPA: winged helix-turn-helix domain-containing protein [Tahibacter sp.]|uniref:winged helix-turn-helix domain-containing protein n=1 Tax=Tahibacter sp. TaxID=2056211 RepID=UPI002CB0723A|nr:winged helix-turn-helix domain-containing protein [Tahibacter sp.]HSX62954.1 winged helix-turn-helix domain-containing protein [Tahibacter sp.]